MRRQSKPPQKIIDYLMSVRPDAQPKRWNRRKNMWEAAVSGEILVRVWDWPDEKSCRVEFFFLKTWAQVNY